MTRTLLTNTVAFALVTFGCIVSAHATTLAFEANLDGLQEVPPNASPAFGLLNAAVDNVSGAFTVTSGSYQDLLGGATAVTINDAAIGTNGPILFALTLDTLAAATGTFSGSGTLTAPQIADVVAGNLYVNIRSQVFPSGEIRSQLFGVPEPSSVMLFALSSFGFLITSRRRLQLG